MNEKTITIKSKAGFYIGDAAFAVTEDRMARIAAEGERIDFDFGEATVDGCPFAYCPTSFGDGFFDGVAVESGAICCLPAELIDQPTINASIGRNVLFARLVEGDEARVSRNGGKYVFAIYKGGKLVEKIEVDTERETDPFDLDWSGAASGEDKGAGKAVKVADVEYEDDDGEDCHVLIKVKEGDTEESIGDALSMRGMAGVYVNEIFDKAVTGRYDDYDVIEVLD